MRVLVVRLGAFGDILHTLPLAADLAGAGHAVGWLCEDRWAGMLQGSPALARIHQLPRRLVRSPTPWIERLSALGRCLRELRSADYEVVIDAQGLAKSAFFAAACGARRRIGHAPPTAREGSWLISRERVATTAVQVIAQQRALGSALGVRAHGPAQFLLPPWEEERRWARTQLALLHLYQPWMLNVGAGWPTKVWPASHQVELVRQLALRRIQLLLLWGTSAEHQAALAVQAAAGYGQVAPSSSVTQLGGLLSHARMVISGDTGPLHLAFALGVPAVGLFGPVPAVRNGPYGAGYRSLQAPAAPWERRDLSKVDMGAITIAQVLAAAESCLAEGALARPSGT
jgi:heptosyltransferase-1